MHARSGRPRVTLVFPPWISHAHNYRGLLQNTLPPLGILSIASYLESKGFRVTVIDIQAEQLSEDAFRQRLLADPPDIVGITVLTTMAVPAHRVARIAKTLFPDCTVVCGGVHAEVLSRETLADSAIDCVVRGDGEEVMLEIAEGRPFREILGLSWREGRALVHNPPRPIEMNLDKYPFPAYHLAPMHLYFPAVGTYKNLPAINMLMARGCPGKCTFCNSANTTLRTRSAGRVVDEIEYLHRRFGIRQVQFYDDTFTVMRMNVEAFCRLMIERRLPVAWTAYARADCFSDDLARLMKRAGCHQVLIGVETGDDEISRRIRKPIPREKTRQTVRIARENGLLVRASFIMGNAGETRESLARSLAYSLEIDPDLVQWSINTPYPGTELYEWAKSEGRLTTEEWTDYDLSRLLIRLDGLPEEEVLRFEREATRRFYLRPRVLLRLLAQARHPRKIRDLLFGFGVFILGLQNRKRSSFMRTWIEGGKAAYQDLNLVEERSLSPLTHAVR